MGEVPGEPHCYIRAGAGQVTLTELTPLLFIVITALTALSTLTLSLGLSLSLSLRVNGVRQLATVSTGLSQSQRVEVGQNIVIQPRQENLAAGVIETTVAVTINILAHHTPLKLRGGDW